jgi:hypothetical protein
MQVKSAAKCMQAWPAGLPRLLMEGAIQQAPQPGRHAIILLPHIPTRMGDETCIADLIGKIG